MIHRLDEIIDALNSDKPLSIIRLGNVEATQLLYPKDTLFGQMETNAGFFGDNEELKKWKNKMFSSLINCDLNLRVVTCPSFFVADDVFTKIKLWKPTLPYIEDLNFYTSMINALKSNNLGFVSYFSKDMERQIPHLKWILQKNGGIKKKATEWKIIHSENTIQGNAPEDRTFSEVYNDLLERSLKADCDIYFLSCGCYGINLCDDLKRAGKKAFYVGGFLQLLFGLKGKRWDDRTVVTQFYNKWWRYPTTKPKNAELVEGGCYWGTSDKSSSGTK